MPTRPFRILVCAFLVLIVAGCPEPPTFPTVPEIPSFRASWLNASWAGGRVGQPNDAKSPQATNAPGRACKPNANFLGSMYPFMDNHKRTPGHLTVVNNCLGLSVSFAICLASGSPTQPSTATPGLKNCATDPLDTPISQLTFVTLTGSTQGTTNFGTFYPSTRNLFVNIFWCTDETQLFTGPIRCV
ncbi:MAG: hypothetical protein BMS9Abin29_0053 [Gemmatimonadota bacterium]|nr:MAG: hypothetical protein BMS9Abin29_0053 [Gemmatimonadota bacterium]